MKTTHCKPSVTLHMNDRRKLNLMNFGMERKVVLGKFTIVHKVCLCKPESTFSKN